MKKVKELIKKNNLFDKSQKFIGQARPLIKKIDDKTHSLHVTSSMLLSDFSQLLANTDFVQNLNNYKSELSKAMDEGFKIGAVDIETQLKFMPNNHRILDGGHGFFESIQKAQEVGAAEGWTDAETFIHWCKAYLTDMSSSAGMPLFDGATDDIYAFLREIGFSEEISRDLVTINGQEAIEALLGGAVASVGLFYAWKKQDQESFSRLLGAMGLGAMVSLNPVVLVILIAAAGIGYNTLVCKNAVQRGATLSFIAMSTSALIPGPLVLGMIAGMTLTMYTNKKMGKDFVPADFFKEILQKLKNPKEYTMILDEVVLRLNKRTLTKTA